MAAMPMERILHFLQRNPDLSYNLMITGFRRLPRLGYVQIDRGLLDRDRAPEGLQDRGTEAIGVLDQDGPMAMGGAIARMPRSRSS